MENVEITTEKARPIDRDFDLSEYVRAHISMFSGEEIEVRLHCRSGLVNAVLDRFGMGVRMIPDKDGEGFVAYVNVVSSKPFFAWVFQFGGDAEIIAPENVRQEYLEMVENVRNGMK